MEGIGRTVIISEAEEEQAAAPAGAAFDEGFEDREDSGESMSNGWSRRSRVESIS